MSFVNPAQIHRAVKLPKPILGRLLLLEGVACPRHGGTRQNLFFFNVLIYF